MVPAIQLVLEAGDHELNLASRSSRGLLMNMERHSSAPGGCFGDQNLGSS